MSRRLEQSPSRDYEWDEDSEIQRWSQSQPQQKFSRYRSVRMKNTSTSATAAPPLPIHGGTEEGRDRHGGRVPPTQQQPEQPLDEGPANEPTSISADVIARSMSRYRHRRSNSVSARDGDDVTKTLNTTAPPLPHGIEPPVPPLLNSLKMGHGNYKSNSSPEKEQYKSKRSESEDASPSPSRRTRPSDLDTTTTQHRRRVTAEQTQSSTSFEENRRRQRMAEREQEAEERRRRDERRREQEEAQRQAEAERNLEEQKKKDLARLQAQLETLQPDPRPIKPRSPVLEKFVMLTKGRKNKDGLSPTSSTSSYVDLSLSRTHDADIPKMKIGIEAGGRGIVPQTDAPTSAINAGERTVTVRCKSRTFPFPVTPETTPVDILYSTAKQMENDAVVDPQTWVVVETQAWIGLERRVRRYEHIRDVMNSWDSDSQNSLCVISSPNPEQDRGLDVASVLNTEEPPSGCQVYMYHSNRPGKWNKRWITLQSNGQILCSKKPEAKLSEKDTTSLCHLSDYDIYEPTESQMRRHLKPPKRHCFAVKSQQKVGIFLNKENYVQYFSTDDPETAERFRASVHRWRSWYLVDRRPEALVREEREPVVSNPTRWVDDRPPQLMVPIAGSKQHTPKKSVSSADAGGHRVRPSVDENSHPIGGFEPLIDMSRFDKRLSQFGNDTAANGARDSVSKARHAQKPSNAGSALFIDGIKPSNDEAFTGGLLGAGYEERKLQAQYEQEHQSKGAGFTDGPSLLNNQQQQQDQSDSDSSAKKPESPSWFPSALQHSAAQQKRREDAPAKRPNTSAGIMHGRRPSHSRQPSLSQHPAFRVAPPDAPPMPKLHARPRTQHNQHGPGAGGMAPPAPMMPAKGSDPAGMSHSNRRGPPKPLVNVTLASTPDVPAQWRKDKHGHGVKPPEGMAHLIDFITVSDQANGARGLLEVPPRVVRRAGSSGGLGVNASMGSGGGGGGGSNGTSPPASPRVPLARARSKSGGPPVSMRNSSANAPPVPPMPGFERRPPRAEDRPRERERVYREKPRDANAVPGRVGTLKVV